MYLAKQFKESPDAESAKHWDRQVIVPSEQVSHLTGRSDKARPDAHDAQSHRARDRGQVLRQADRLGECLWQRESALEHEVLVAGHGSDGGDEPSVPEVGSGHANNEGGQRPGEGLAAAQSRGIFSPEPAECAGGRIAPAE